MVTGRDGTPVPSASGLQAALPFVEADGIGMPSLRLDAGMTSGLRVTI
ncbi:MAG: hypothetical protein IJ160_02620 [Muribaculaceae bacterium]|nr:hypothetical protein [Muribaculaceae bacterium]